MLAPVQVAEVMETAVETVGPDVPLLAVAERLQGQEIGSVVVVRDGTPVGIVTESEFVRLLADGREPGSLTAADCMSAPLVTVAADADIERAVELLREHGVKKLPVLRGGDLAGIVTTTDLSYFLPHLTGRTTDRPGEGERPDTAYEEGDWEFENLGPDDEIIEIGDVVQFSKTLDDEDVRAFADSSGDTNRLHLDDAFAAESRFGRRIVHGTLVAGVISAALARLPGLIIYLSQDLSYLGPVDIGDRVTASCKVVEDIGHDRYRLTTAVRDPDGETVVDGEAVVVADPLPGE